MMIMVMIIIIMVCFRYIIVNILHKSDDNYDNNNDDVLFQVYNRKYPA